MSVAVSAIRLPTRSAEIVTTPDSAPVGWSQARARWTTPAFLATFAAASLVLHSHFQTVLYVYERLVSRLSGVSRGVLTTQASISIRPLLALLLACVAVWAAGSWQQRLLLVTALLVADAIMTLLVDVALAMLMRAGGPPPFSGTGNVLVAVVDVSTMGIVLLARFALPSGVPVERRVFRPKTAIIWLAVTSSVAGVVVQLLHTRTADVLQRLTHVPLLGGATSSILLFLSSLYLMLFAFGSLSARPRAGAPPIWPSVAFLVPARNEVEAIQSCIKGIDRAAREYEGGCTIYVVENGSSDATLTVAKRALTDCRYADGVLLQAEPRGKAAALNVGLSQTREDIIVRVDADTVVFPDVVRRIALHLEELDVGGVSGMPLPEATDSWFQQMRGIEVFYNVGYKRVGQGLLDAITVLPGAMVAFRRAILVRLGGFAEGINGEDADITVRVGRLGYRIVSDPAIAATTGTPRTIAELREQRIRWARGLYHMIGRNRDAVRKLQGIRGGIQLPWACLSNFHKLILIPLGCTAFIMAAASGSLLPFREIAAGAALLIGFQLAQTALVLVCLGGTELLPSLPSFLIFRLIVTYFSIEALLSLRLKPSGTKQNRDFDPVTVVVRTEEREAIAISS